jgi:hypothetical protein
MGELVVLLENVADGFRIFSLAEDRSLSQRDALSWFLHDPLAEILVAYFVLACGSKEMLSFLLVSSNYPFL